MHSVIIYHYLHHDAEKTNINAVNKFEIMFARWCLDFIQMIFYVPLALTIGLPGNILFVFIKLMVLIFQDVTSI